MLSPNAAKFLLLFLGEGCAEARALNDVGTSLNPISNGRSTTPPQKNPTTEGPSSAPSTHQLASPVAACHQEGISAIFLSSVPQQNPLTTKHFSGPSNPPGWAIQGCAHSWASPALLVNQSIPALLSSPHPPTLTEVFFFSELHLGNCSNILNEPALFMI